MCILEVLDSLLFYVSHGTKVGNLNCLAAEQDYKSPGGDEAAAEGPYKVLSFEQLSQAETLSIGCAVEVQGKLTLSPPNATQKFELQATRISLIGGVEDHINYPINKSTEKKVISSERQQSLKILDSVINGGGAAKEKAIRKGKFAKGETAYDYEYNDGLGAGAFKKKKVRVI